MNKVRAVMEDVVLPHHQPVVKFLAARYVDEPRRPSTNGIT
jgi:hypothetical protein